MLVQVACVSEDPDPRLVHSLAGFFCPLGGGLECSATVSGFTSHSTALTLRYLAFTADSKSLALRFQAFTADFTTLALQS